MSVQIELTPPLALAAALLYMMLSNGEVEKAEIDQLQSVIGKNADLLRCAVDYVQMVPVDRFIDEVPHVLCEADQLCVLTNMCDAMLSDGQTDAAELDLLARLAAAFGLSDEDFQPFYEAIALKNDKTVLGRFDRAKLETQQATPHLGHGRLADLHDGLGRVAWARRNRPPAGHDRRVRGLAKSRGEVRAQGQVGTVLCLSCAVFE